MSKTKLILVSAVVLFSFGTAVSISADEVVNETQVTQTNTMTSPVSNNFINKFDKAISLENGRFIINFDALPADTTQSEISQLQQLVFQNNNILLENANNQNATISTDNKSINFSEQTDGINGRLRFREGSNYVHLYWWGLRIGISRSTLMYVGGGVGIAGIWIPEPLISKIIATLGAVTALAPGGIVFNSTPGLANFWGVEWQ
ncbi:MAG: hypothetical protein LBS41_06230 [Streptococcaceae bacterium]|jgi:hypothetical protein|nr:hypothetical protein [Streptococcaceae bacterium]